MWGLQDWELPSVKINFLTERLTKLFNWLMTGPKTARPNPAETQAAETRRVLDGATDSIMRVVRGCIKSSDTAAEAGRKIGLVLHEAAAFWVPFDTLVDFDEFNDAVRRSWNEDLCPGVRYLYGSFQNFQDAVWSAKVVSVGKVRMWGAKRG